MMQTNHEIKIIIITFLLYIFTATLVTARTVADDDKSNNARQKCEECRETQSIDCFTYDSRYTAATLSEAIGSFVDTTNPDPTTATTITGEKAKQIEEQESTRLPTWPGFGQTTTTSPPISNAAKTCGNYLLHIYPHLGEGEPLESLKDTFGPVDGSLRNSIQSFLGDFMQFLPPTLQESGKSCRSFVPILQQYASRLTGVQEQKVSTCVADAVKDVDIPDVPDIPDIPGETTTVDSSTTDSSYSSTTTIHEESTPWWHFFRNRNTRQASEYGSEFQYVYTIRCVARGEPVSEGSNSNGLCNICWKWGVLTSEYWPSYINMMSCDSSTRCLGGYGECEQRYRSMSVLKNVDGQWSTYSLNIPSCCDCQVTSGNALHNFIKS